jgi:hypothetical protein
VQTSLIRSKFYAGIVLSALMCLFSISSANAELLNFDFSFVGDPSHSTVNGTVTGEIIGLQNNATSAPSDIIITSAPAGLGLLGLSYDLKANGWNLSSTGDTLTVANGVITNADYQATFGGGDFFDLNFSVVNNGVTVAGLNGLETQGETFTANLGGLSGATYTSAGLTAPEPSTWALLLGGLSMLALVRLRGRVI